jgi:hypothetical protein
MFAIIMIERSSLLDSHIGKQGALLSVAVILLYKQAIMYT